MKKYLLILTLSIFICGCSVTKMDNTTRITSIRTIETPKGEYYIYTVNDKHANTHDLVFASTERFAIGYYIKIVRVEPK